MHCRTPLQLAIACLLLLRPGTPASAAEPAAPAEPTTPRQVPIAMAWASTAVNVVVFRHDSLVSDERSQYASFYNPEGRMVLARRTLGSEHWEVHTAPYGGNVRDAHNTICLGLDGRGLLHVCWDHHGGLLNYCQAVSQGELELTGRLPMTASHENRVTYPEFYSLPDGDLLLFFRDGASGGGNVALNRYDVRSGRWTQLHDNLIDGEGRRNAYWQACVGSDGAVHLSWVWRESPDAASNHDLCYACSKDGGACWQRSDGSAYELPIRQDSAEIALHIDQGSDLINQTSICVDRRGRPYVATYWRPPGARAPQYHVVYHDGNQWRAVQAMQRRTDFSLSGGGTLRIAASRPLLLCQPRGDHDRFYLVFRDADRKDRVSVARTDDVASNRWDVLDLTKESVGRWEPTHDSRLWQRVGQLHLLVERVGQGHHETLESTPDQMATVLEWQPD